MAEKIKRDDVHVIDDGLSGRSYRVYRMYGCIVIREANYGGYLLVVPEVVEGIVAAIRMVMAEKIVWPRSYVCPVCGTPSLLGHLHDAAQKERERLREKQIERYRRLAARMERHKDILR